MTAAQSIVQKAAIPPTNGLGTTPVLDLVKEDLLVTTKVNEHIAKILVDQQTTGTDLISSTFYTLHKIALYKMNPPVTLQMTMKGSRSSLTHYVIVQLDWLAYLEERTMLVATLKDWDVILESPALRDMKAVINMSTMTVLIQPHEQACFTLQQWIPVSAKKMTRKRTQPAFPPPIYAQSANQIVSAATTLKESVNPFDEFPDVFPETKKLDLPLLRPGMDYRIQLKDPDLKISPQYLKLKHKFLPQLFEKLRHEQKSGRVYKPTSPDQSCSVIFMIHKIDKPDEARLLHDLVARNDNTYDDPPNVHDQSNIINAVANAKFHSKIDLSDGYYNLCIIPEHEKHIAFKTPFGVYRTRVMQQGDKNAPWTFQNAMNTLFQDRLGVFVYIYINDIFIFSKTYKEHVNYVRHVLKKLQDNQFYTDRKKSQFLPEELRILGHAITRRGIQPVLGRVRKILDWPTSSNVKKLRTFLGMVNYCSQFAPQLATISSPLTAMAGSTTN